MHNKVHDTLLFIQEEEDKCAFAYIYTKYIWRGTLRSSKLVSSGQESGCLREKEGRGLIQHICSWALNFEPGEFVPNSKMKG